MEIYRMISLAKKMRLWMNARETGKQIAMAGLRMRNPDATEEQIWHMWARQQLGDELYEAAYRERIDADRAKEDSGA
jgi:hypothetical protein